MKHTAKRWLVSCLSMLLVLSLVLSVSPAVLAAESRAVSTVRDVNGDGKILYVSFGDSVTNGYGMDGYRYEDGGNMVGFKREVATAYPAMIRDELASRFGANNVDLEQLAISGFRMDELHCLLDEEFVGDDYHYKYFNSWFDNLVAKWKRYESDDYYSKYTDGQDTRQVLRTEYTNAVKNADLITIDLGTNNFGTFMTNRIQVILGIGGMEVEMDFTQFMDEGTYRSMDAILGQMVAQLVGGTDSDAYPLAKTIADTLLYGYLGFTTHFDASMEKIYELNPNAQVVVIDVYNMMSGVAMTGETFGDSIDLGQLYGIFVDMANLYTRELSPYAAKVTHASLNTDPELFFDYYADYPDDAYPENQYLHPTAERLMNEFVMEAMGYDPDEPEEREQFQKEIKDAIDTLDSYVNNLQATVKENVIDAEVVPGIKNGVQTAVDGVDASIEGVELVKTAVEGEAQAQGLVDMIVELVLGNATAQEYFTGSSTSSFVKSIMIDTIRDEMAGMDITAFGFEDTEENRDLLAEEVYEVACIYYDEEHRDGGSNESANKLAVLEVMRFVLVERDGYSNDEAIATAEKAYAVAQVYNAELASTNNEESAMLAALTSQVGEEKAQQAMQVYAIYTQNGGGTDDNAANSAARDATIVTMIKTQYSQEGLAEAMYAVYCGNATTEQEQLAYIAAMVSAGIDQTVATAIYTCYATDLDGQYNNEYVKTTMIFLMMKAMNMDQGTAEENYSRYLTYKNLPTTLSKIAKNKTIYIDYLLAAASSGIDLGAIADEFMAGTLKLDDPGPNATQEEIDEFRSDSSLATLYMRFMAQDGVFIHPSEVGQKDLTACVKTALNNLNTFAADETATITKDTVITSIGDSIAAGSGLAEDAKNFGELVAERLGTENYNEFAFEGMRLNDFRYILDSSYSGDSYTAENFKANKSDLNTAATGYIKDSDIILVDLGAMNLGFIAAQINKYTSENGATYPMTFGSISNMAHRNLGKNVDSLLDMVQDKLGEGPSDVGTLLLAFESYGYGYTTFTDCLDAVISKIRTLNADATIVLVGQYDLLGDAYFSNGSVQFAAGEFIHKATNLMNDYMCYYAEVATNCIYVDVSDTATALDAIQASQPLNLAGTTNNTSNIAIAFSSAHPTADGHKSMASKIACALGGHSTESEPTWTWASDYSSASASFNCNSCGNNVTLDAAVSSDIKQFCDKEGTATYTASVTIGSQTYTDTKTETLQTIDHSWDEGVVTKEPTETETGIRTFTCNGCGETKTEAIPVLDHEHKYTSVVTDPTCTEKGYTTYTCECGDSYVGDEVDALGHSYTSVVTDPTCTEKGYTTYTCSVCEDTYTDDEVDALGHDYEDGVCTVCGVKESSVSRLSGANRYSTAFNAANAMKEVLGVETFDNIVVAYGRNFADALAGSYLANELDAPILLTEDSFQADVIDYIAENLSEDGKVYILGGTSSVSASFEEDLEDADISCERLSGDNRYLTNLEILTEAGLNGKTILVCDGNNFADSLSASSLDLPILLVGSSLSKDQKDYLDTLDDVSFRIIGGVNSVSDAIAEALKAYGTVERISGETREETSVKVAEAFFSSPETALIAYSRNFPDGLCGGPLAYQLGAPLILVNSGAESFAADYVADNEITSGIILGGTSSIPDDVANAVFPQ